jgi:hypothetical protein
MMPREQDGQIVYGCEPNELGHNTLKVMWNFSRVYEYTLMGIRSADPDGATGRIGGVAIALPNISGIWWTRLIARYFGMIGLPIDFYSWHAYDIDESLSQLLGLIQTYKPLTIDLVRQFFENTLRGQGFNGGQVNLIVGDIYDYLKDLEQQDQQAIRFPYSFVSSHLDRVLVEEGYGATGLFLTEWNVNYFPDRRHDTHYGASFITRGLVDIVDSHSQIQNLYNLSSGRFYYDRGYGGRFSIFTLDGNNVPKASFNALKLFSMLGDEAERIHVDVSDDELYAIATKNGNNISLLATYYVMAEDPQNPNYGLSKSVTLSISNIPFSQYHYRVYLIDGDHSNSFYGSGPELEVVDSGTGSGDFEIVMDLAIYGVIMIEVEQMP